MPAQPQVNASDVVETVRFAARRQSMLTGAEDVTITLSILSRALICACKTVGLPKALVHKEIDAAWDDTRSLVPIIERKVG